MRETKARAKRGDFPYEGGAFIPEGANDDQAGRHVVVLKGGREGLRRGLRPRTPVQVHHEHLLLCYLRAPRKTSPGGQTDPRNGIGGGLA